jgi:hypothetical protein
MQQIFVVLTGILTITNGASIYLLSLQRAEDPLGGVYKFDRIPFAFVEDA